MPPSDFQMLKSLSTATSLFRPQGALAVLASDDGARTADETSALVDDGDDDDGPRDCSCTSLGA